MMIDRRKRYAIWGTGRVQKDFRYIFDDIKIVFLFNEKYETELIQYDGIPVVEWNKIKKNRDQYDMLIICDFPSKRKKEKEQYLIEWGFCHGTDYVYEEDLFESLDGDVCVRYKNRTLAVWGTGRRSIALREYIEKERISFFIDNDKSKKKFQNKEVIYPEDIQEWKGLFVVIASSYYYDIANQLRGFGLEEGRDFVRYDIFFFRPSELLKKTIFDQSYISLTCHTMMNTFEAGTDGRVSCCCTAFVEEKIGNLVMDNFTEIWGSWIHKILCLSANNKTYTFCDSQKCPLLMNKNRCSYDQMDWRGDSYKKMERHPRTLLISIDRSCNLACTSCRNEIIREKNENLQLSMIMADKIISDILPHTDFWVLAGNGEIFVSPVYKKIYESDASRYPSKMRILTNGILFDKEKWEDINRGRNSCVYLTVSVDAATAETYAKIRKFGNFTILLRNLEFASKLRQEGKLSYLQISFVVQRLNYREMPEFVNLAKCLKADKAFFTQIVNWGTYSEEEFKDISMIGKDGFPLPELEEILKLPIMKEQIVDLGTIRWDRNREDPDRVENYYEWEIDHYMKME